MFRQILERLTRFYQFRFAEGTAAPEGGFVKIRRQHVIVGGVALLGLIFLVIGVMAQRKMPKYYAHSLRHWQEADSVAGYPIQTNAEDKDAEPEFISAEFIPALSSMSPQERYRLPVARYFTKPTAATAAGNGLILYAGKPDEASGEVVLLGHRLPDGRIMQTFYGGLENRFVIVGEVVARGSKIGQAAETGLTFEIREGVGIDPMRRKPATDQIDEAAFFKERAAPSDLPELLGILRKEESDPEKVLEIHYGQ